jgi:hypothetical protein
LHINFVILGIASFIHSSFPHRAMVFKAIQLTKPITLKTNVSHKISQEYPAGCDLMENQGGADDLVFFWRLDEMQWRTNPMISDASDVPSI